MSISIRGLLSVILIASAIGVSSPKAQAQVMIQARTAPPPAVRVGPAMGGGPFDRIGFLSRVTLGGGYLYTDTPNWSLRAPCLSFSVTGGISVTPQLTLQAELWAGIGVGPTLEVDGSSALLDADSSLNTGGLGVGMTYFFPMDVGFLSVVVGPSVSQLEIRESTLDESGLGWGTHMLLGRDWWVSPHATVGIAAELMVMMNPEQDGDGWFNTIAGGVTFLVSRM